MQGPKPRPPVGGPVAQVAMCVSSASSFFDGAALSFKFYRSDRITWHLHFLEPCCQGLLIRGLHDAYIFPSDRLEKLRYGCTVESFWAASAILFICSRVRAPTGTVWLLMNLAIIFVLSLVCLFLVWRSLRVRIKSRQRNLSAGMAGNKALSGKGLTRQSAKGAPTGELALKAHALGQPERLR